MKFAVLTISDTCFNKTATDTSGPHLIQLIAEKFNATDINYQLVPDELDLIRDSLVKCSDELGVNAIFTTGGTGFAPRDVTPEATKAVLTKEAPQLSLAMTLTSLQKTKFAVLSRAVCGVRNKTLIVNFPGSKKAVEECFLSIVDVVPHLLQLLNDDVSKVKETHKKVQSGAGEGSVHVCPHATGKGGDDRNSPFPMIEVDEALRIILSTIENVAEPSKQTSRVNIPPFRASIKDGYAVKSIGGRGTKHVVGSVSAGDGIIMNSFTPDECYKINTGGPVPDQADAIVQIEDTKLISSKNGSEEVVEILVDPTPNLDIRPIGTDLQVGEEVFEYRFPLNAAQKSLLASIGEKPTIKKLRIAIISTGDELVHPYESAGDSLVEGKIFDSNTTMLVELLKQFGFGDEHCEIEQFVVKDEYDALKQKLQSLTGSTNFIISTGGVSMGDKDFVKPVLQDLGYDLKFGRINMKPGKPCTFATNGATKFFGLPGNPVSAFVTFHLFALPALRKYISTFNGTTIMPSKLLLPKISVELLNESYNLDPRPEYARASVISRGGKLFAKITGGQLSSRLKSIVEADVLLHLPARSANETSIVRGKQITASVLRADFISGYD
ncbi:molybdenum cofactor synthesis protein cinnamon [Uranotaenia lowii]|uniref:molybdenum cofactor synthesis protein cinnamon n=1 Tax=Uranotaenia lowii TaxID=190385 RepID=UPI00247B23AC|nr:molybdenum cofactor synthesis protein cinnamon [Uranotaenia lowii]